MTSCLYKIFILSTVPGDQLSVQYIYIVHCSRCPAVCTIYLYCPLFQVTSCLYKIFILSTVSGVQLSVRDIYTVYVVFSAGCIIRLDSVCGATFSHPDHHEGQLHLFTRHGRSSLKLQFPKICILGLSEVV